MRLPGIFFIVIFVSIRLSIVVPVYNEGAHLEEHLERLRGYLDAFCSERCAYEIVVVDDASTDDTAAALACAQRRIPALKVLTHTVNRGMSGALATGAGSAAGEIVVAFDSDLTYAPATIGQLVDAIDGGADVALASAYARGGRCVRIPWTRAVLSRNANRFLSLATRGRIATLTCMVRAYRADLLRRLYASGRPLEGTFGLLFAALQSGARIAEIPATLDWSMQPADRARRLNVTRLLRHSWEVFCAGIRARPLLLLGVPGLIPGLLPAVATGALLARIPARETAICVAATIAVQYGSLLLLSFQLGGYAVRRHISPSHRFRRT